MGASISKFTPKKSIGLRGNKFVFTKTSGNFIEAIKNVICPEKALLGVFAFALLSGCGTKAIQSEHFSFDERGKVSEKYEANEKDSHFTYFLPKSALEISFEGSKLSFKHVAVADANAAYLLTKEEPLFTKTSLALSDGGQNDGEEGSEGFDGILDRIRFSTGQDFDSRKVKRAFDELGGSVTNNSAALERARAPNGASAQLGADSGGVRNAALFDPYHVSEHEAPQLAHFKIYCTEFVDLTVYSKNFTKEMENRGLTHPVQAKTICETPRELDRLGYKLSGILETDFDLVSLKKNQHYVYPASAKTKEETVTDPCLFDQADEKRKKCSAIVHRKRWPAQITLVLSHELLPGDEIIVTAPMPIFDTTTAYKVPIRGKALVAVETKASFEGGQLVYYEDIRPSTAARAVLFPAEIIASTFGVVVAVVTLAL